MEGNDELLNGVQMIAFCKEGDKLPHARAPGDIIRLRKVHVRCHFELCVLACTVDCQLVRCSGNVALVVDA